MDRLSEVVEESGIKPATTAEVKPEVKLFSVPVAGELSLDEISKLAAMILVTIYICGYIVLSLYFSKFGFIQTSPLRPRVLEAGASALFWTAIPVLIGVAAKHLPARSLSPLKVVWNKLLFVPFLCHLFLSSPGLDGWTWSSAHSASSSNSVHISLSQHLFWFALIVIAYLLPYVALKRYYSNWRLAIAIQSVNLACVVYLQTREHSNHALFIWFSIIGCSSLLISEACEPRQTNSIALAGYFFGDVSDSVAAAALVKALRFYRPVSLVTTAVFLVWAFSTFVYGVIPSTFGGGAPTLAGIIVKDAADPKHSRGSNSGAYFIIDQSDQGVFVFGARDESQVEFIPKEVIQEIIFSRP